jgi:hypothetical protein
VLPARRFLLKAYLRTRLHKIERFVIKIIDDAAMQQKCVRACPGAGAPAPSCRACHGSLKPIPRNPCPPASLAQRPCTPALSCPILLLCPAACHLGKPTTRSSTFRRWASALKRRSCCGCRPSSRPWCAALARCVRAAPPELAKRCACSYRPRLESCTRRPVTRGDPFGTHMPACAAHI